MIRSTSQNVDRRCVVHVVPALFGDEEVAVGGAERYAFELARHMADAVPTRLVAFGPKDRDETVGKLRVRVIGRPWHVRGHRFNPFSLKLLGELSRARVVHCHQRYIVASSVSAAFGRLSGRRVFVSDLGGGGWDISAYVSTERWYRAHLHISQYSRRISGHDDAPWAHVIWGGVDTDKFSPASAVPRDGGVLFVGRLLPHKGVDVLVDAMPPEIPLTIMGRARHDDYLRLLHERARGKRVTFVHDATDEQIVAAYRRALCIVLPSVYRTCYGDAGPAPELLGQTLLEGMACGAPAICADVASMPEVVEHGVTGFVVPPNDAQALGEKIRWLSENSDGVERMGSASRDRVLKRFTWSSVVQRCLAIYGL